MLIAVLGLGHVGLPTALAFCEVGYTVVGSDHDKEKARLIASGKSPFYEPGLEELLSKHLTSGRLLITEDVEGAIRQSEVLFLCVGTPQHPDGSPDLSQVDSVAHAIACNLNSYKLIIVKSTVPVHTAHRLRQIIARCLNCDIRDVLQNSFDIASNPEFMRGGSAIEDCLRPNRIVLGVDTQRARDLLLRLYRPWIMRGLPEERLVVVDVATAELIKYAANAFLALKISYVNFLADICEATGTDITQVAYALGLDPRIGPYYLQAGLGYGGYCLPKDLRAFIHLGQELRVDTGLLEATGRINDSRVDRFLEKIRRALPALKEKVLGIWGLSFKPGTDDVREAPSLRIIGKLLNEGAKVRLYDPVAMQNFQKEVPPSEAVYYAEDLYDTVQGAHALLLVTEWPEFCRADFERVRSLMELAIVIDGRNALDPKRLNSLGFEYYGMGRGCES
jgi:UDPglucose 6-dehydrogenase